MYTRRMTANGKLDPKTLTELSVGGNQRLLTNAAKSYERLAKAFRKRFGKVLSVTDSYRPYEDQKRIFLARYDHTPRAGNTYANGGIKRWNGKTWHKKAGVAVAAQPGWSNHGWGLALDLGAGVNRSFTSPEYLWMQANAPAYGWTNIEGRPLREPWHWVYSESTDRRKNDKVETVAYITRSTTKTKQKAARTWKTIVIDDNKSDVSVVSNKTGVFDSRLKATIKGLPEGRQIQVRAVRVEKDKAGKRQIQHRYPIIERIGTPGGTFIDAEQVGKVRSNQRIRWQIVAFDDNVVLDSVTVQSLVHEG